MNADAAKAAEELRVLRLQREGKTCASCAHAMYLQYMGGGWCCLARDCRLVNIQVCHLWIDLPARRQWRAETG